MKFIYNSIELILFIFLFIANKIGLNINPFSCCMVIVFHFIIYIFDQAEKITNINNSKEAMKSLQELKSLLTKKDIPYSYKMNGEEGYN